MGPDRANIRKHSLPFFPGSQGRKWVIFESFILLFILLWVSPAFSAIHYIDGEYGSDSNSGTSAEPWKTWEGPRSKGSIKAGDTVYFKAGTYAAGGTTFRNSVWRIQGTPGKNITVAPDPAASGEWPVKITGRIKIFDEYAIIKGFEFDGLGMDDDAIKNYASYITFQGNYVHSAGRDCIKNSATQQPGGVNRVTDVSIIDNIICDCDEDAIDNTGAINIIIRGNDIYRYRYMQLKGGTENVLIENNTFHESSSIFSGNSMGCNSYCAGPHLPKLAVPDRYVAKNVTIRNNLFYNLRADASTGIKMNGWRDSQVYNNTFYDLGNSWAILLEGGEAGNDYRDAIAAKYCKDNVNSCEKSCLKGDLPEDGCYRITHTPKNIQVRNNIFVNQTHMASVDNASTNISFSNNIYWNGGSGMSFNYLGTSYRSVKSFPPESNSGSYQQDPELTNPGNLDFTLGDGSIAINNGYALFDLSTDYEGNLRDENPDIGAYEYGSIMPPLSVTTTSLPDARVGVDYNQDLAATGGAPPYSWNMEAGNLPAGLTLSIDGILGGIPEQSGQSEFMIQVTDANVSTATKEFMLTVLNEDEVNLANGTTHIRDSENFRATEPVENLWDGEYTQQAGSPGNTGIDSFWVEYDLGQMYDLSMIRFCGDAEGIMVSKTYSVLVKADESDPYTPVIDHEDCFSSDMRQTDLSAVSARYIKLVVVGDTVVHATQCREFEVFGYPIE